MTNIIWALSQPAIVAALLNVAATIIIAVVGWRITTRVASKARESAEAIGQAARDSAESVAMAGRALTAAQAHTSEHDLLLKLMARRLESRIETSDAIYKRLDEIEEIKRSGNMALTAQATRFMEAKAVANVLFGDDVRDILAAISDCLLMRAGTQFSDNRETKIQGCYEVKSSTIHIMMLTSLMERMMDRYSDFGNVRATALAD